MNTRKNNGQRPLQRDRQTNIHKLDTEQLYRQRNGDSAVQRGLTRQKR